MYQDSASKKLFANPTLKQEIVSAVETAIASGVFETKRAVYNLDGNWYAFLEGNEIFVLNYQKDKEKREKDGPLAFFVGMMANFVDSTKKLYRQFILGEVPGADGWVGAVFPTVCKVGEIPFVKTTLVWRHADYSAPLLETDRASIVGNPDMSAPRKSELGYLLSNNARITGPISVGVVVFSAVDATENLPGGRDGWMPVSQYILESHEPMTISALAKGEKAGAF